MNNPKTEEIVKTLRFEADKHIKTGAVCVAAADLIEQLQQELIDERYRHDRLQDFCVAQGEELSKLKERQRLIPVTEKVPEENEDGTVNAVLVTDGFLQHMAYFVNGDWVFCESGEAKGPMFYEVTHWMPLPELPKED